MIPDLSYSRAWLGVERDADVEKLWNNMMSIFFSSSSRKEGRVYSMCKQICIKLGRKKSSVTVERLPKDVILFYFSEQPVDFLKNIFEG